ncbi:hypothetical protein TCE0_013f01302 [Talaromyces pinophilus]|uniref:Uncharacterized protein n=1 Tax=Talaromyces pinophilus TaxID=128442 RepID=A0A698XLW9_TALPI|nr:hypothetical protein DPV78_010826 [Talaromyces pinophilus]GAM34000.1 hypothetical protein TCE0_013f01302 [Talaromyces pinophilus]
MSSLFPTRWSFRGHKTPKGDGTPTETASQRDSLPVSESGRSSRGQGYFDRRHVNNSIDDASKYKAMIKFFHVRLTAYQWLPPPTHPQHSSTGVFLRRSRGIYMSEPEDINPLLLAAIQRINATIAFTMMTETTSIITSQLAPGQTELILPNGYQVQIIESYADIVGSHSNMVKKYQYAALIREEQLLLVWNDDLNAILNHAADVEGKLLSLIWGSPIPTFNLQAVPMMTPGESVVASPNDSLYHLALEPRESPAAAEDSGTSRDASPRRMINEEVKRPKESLERPLAVTSAIFVGMAGMLLVILLLGFGISNLLLEYSVDGGAMRFALTATIPFFLLFSIFFMIVIFTDIFQAVGPVKTLKSNSRFYSPIAPDLKTAYSLGFTPPRVTIQMPIYTESLEGVIKPTISSLKTAISHYESHGGTANIFINDDGFALLSEEQQHERINFYHDNNIGWVARPKNNEDGYIRKGKFKKASNMNFALNVSNKVEMELIQRMAPTLEKSDMVDPMEEELVYREAFDHVIQSDPRIRGAGGDIRVGEFILIVDSDTRIPADCLLYGAAEMFLSPEVAIIQHSTSVMQVSQDYFENGITYFTNLIYSAIRFAVGSGETAPFVGHNAFLRWQAVQSVGRPDDGYVSFWSESHVSEDFDIALRLQIQGNIIRLASYHNDEFKEGVSLTIYDELSRWEKYAYGCNELVFNPVHTWFYRGPLTKLFMTFLWSNLQLSSKITILGYISSYYALASGFPLTVLNYFLVGWFEGYLDKFYMESWKVFLSLLVVFSAAGNVCLAIIRYRLGEKPLLASLVENFMWMPMFAIFFGGLSFHLSLAILSHMFGINMSWGTTAKEKDDSNFFKEIPKIFKSFKWMYAVVLPFFPAMIYLACFAPNGWTITEVGAIVPMSVTLASHALLPLLLNPSLMVFNY